jgi:transcriptional regulator with XRE-family HTH domain
MSNKFKIDFGKKLKELRLSKGLTQEELYFRSTVSRSHIGMIEKGKRDITLSAIFKLSRALEVNLTSFFDFDSLEKYKFKNKEL